MNQVFAEIANRENGKLSIKDEIVSMGMGVRSPYTVYTILLHYKGVEIVVHNQVGTKSIGSITCQFPIEITVPSFELETRSNFITLFIGKKNRFRISCKDLKFKEYLKQEISEANILIFIQKDQFEPYLTSQKNKDKTVVRTEYSLLFEDWPLVISPLLGLNKKIIDWIIQKNIHIEMTIK